MPTPVEIKKTSPTEVTIDWDDGHASLFTTKLLRTECMCAGCVSEATGERLLDPNTVPENITIKNAQHVGLYGVQYFFSDGHKDGIYTWVKLREICPCDECRAKK